MEECSLRRRGYIIEESSIVDVFRVQHHSTRSNTRAMIKFDRLFKGFIIQSRWHLVGVSDDISSGEVIIGTDRGDHDDSVAVMVIDKNVYVFHKKDKIGGLEDILKRVNIKIDTIRNKF